MLTSSPPNTSHEELWKYIDTTIPTGAWRGPSSIFLITRSSCAFVNWSSQEDLNRAVSFFNGKSLRPWDPRCPRMVCRVRRQDDDLRAGVGAQRGTGMHQDWVKQRQARSVSPLQPVELPSPAALEHPTDGDGRGRESTVDAQDGSDTNCKSTDSYTSTNSSFFKRYFPRRVFILKSMTTVGFEVFGTRLTSGGARGKCRDRALEDTEAQRADPRYATRNATPLTYQTRRFGRRQRCS
jgi:hypothetical protein